MPGALITQFGKSEKVLSETIGPSTFCISFLSVSVFFSYYQLINLDRPRCFISSAVFFYKRFSFSRSIKPRLLGTEIFARCQRFARCAPDKNSLRRKKKLNKRLGWGLGSQGRCGGESNRGGEGGTKKVSGEPIPDYAGGSFEHEIYADLFCDVDVV